MVGWVVTGFVLKKHRKRKNQRALHALMHAYNCVLRSRSTVSRAARQVLHGCTDPLCTQCSREFLSSSDDFSDEDLAVIRSGTDDR